MTNPQSTSLKTISELISILEQAKETFGDIPVGAHSAEYCHELSGKNDLLDVELRVLSSYERSTIATSLPGTNPATMEGQDQTARFLAIFYLDQP